LEFQPDKAAYDAMNNLLTKTDRRNQTMIYGDDAAGKWLTKTALQQANPTPVSVLSEYSYDNIYQLTQTLVDQSLAESYTYDAVGNRLTSLDPASYTYNSSNQLTASSAATYTYDYNGNTLSKTDTNGTTYYTWDYENRLTQVTLPGEGGTVYFNYDPFGRRIRKSFGSATTIYAYDGDNVIEELDGSGSVLARYTQGAGIDEPLAMYRGLTTAYFHADGLGSITSLTDGVGQLSASYVYDSFGKLTASTGTLTNPFQYTSREFDSETGLYCYRARYYAPSVGRFIAEDPSLFPGTVNVYRYTLNDPVNMVDPSGLAECFYRISTHTLQCSSDNNRLEPPIFVGPQGVSSGKGACRDDPSCSQELFRGPIPPGEYRMNRDLRPGHDGIFRLEPVPRIPGWQVRLFWRRGGFELHLGTTTLGCINVLKTEQNAMEQYNRLRKLLEAEDDQNYLLVAP
jgi:RHS repeat-associated protein